MSARTVRRRLAAGATTLALAGIGVLGVGVTAASAVDAIPDSPYFGGTFYLANGDSGEDYVPGTSALAWHEPAIALVAPGDLESSIPTPATATGVSTFIAPRGSEWNRDTWHAYADWPLGQWLQNVTPYNQIVPGPGSPSGTGATAAVSGEYSIGWAYTINNGLTVIPGGLFYVHITLTGNAEPTLATYTYQPVELAAAPLPSTTTTITSFPSTVQENTAFDLTATVSEATATGDVEFFNGSTSLGTAALSGGTATLNVAAGLPAGSASVTAVYEGDSAFSGSTSAAVSISVTGEPQDTEVIVSATSSDGFALHPATLSATVTADNSTTPTGSVTFTGSVDGGSVVTLASNVTLNSSGVASVTLSSLTVGTWTINAAFTGTGVYQPSASTTPATLELAGGFPSADPDPQNVTVDVPEGTLTITTPYTSASPLALGTATLNDQNSTWSASAAFGSGSDIEQAIKIVDTRAGQPGFTAQVASTDFSSGPGANQSFSAAHAGLVDLAAHQVTGNHLQASDITTTDVPANTPGLGATAQTFAAYPAGLGIGTAWLTGTFELDDVETSILPGTYEATVTFTAF